MVTGSFASAMHGQPRTTRNIVVVIDPDDDAIEVLVTAFPPERFYVGDAAAAVRRRDMFNIIDTQSGWKVDLIVRKVRPFSEVEFGRRQSAIVDGVAAPIGDPPAWMSHTDGSTAVSQPRMVEPTLGQDRQGSGGSRRRHSADLAPQIRTARTRS